MMRYLRFLAASLAGIAVVCLLASCGGNAASNAFKTETESSADSIVHTGFHAVVTLKVDYPVDGNPALLRNVREWISESLGGLYEGSLDKGDSLTRFYVANKLGQAAEYDDPGLEQADSSDVDHRDMYYTSDETIKKEFENDEIVSFSYTGYNYAGGAHGSSYVWYMSFRKEDGRRLDKSLFISSGIDSEMDISKAVKKGIAMQYFNLADPTTDAGEEALGEFLLNEQDKYLFPMPQSNPFFMADSVRFIYQQYEISCYALGMPTCTIAYKDLLDYGCLSVTAKQLLIPDYKPSEEK
jgi:Protein of unknown function (DUF3298).